MNTDQFQSLIRTVVKIISGLLIAHGMSDTAGVLNSPDVIGSLLLVCSLIWSHYAHGDIPPTNPPSVGNGVKAPLLILPFVVVGGLLFAGCASAPRVTYQAASTSAVTVETALHAYDLFAAAGKTTPAQNAAVKAAYLKYQAAFAVVCDAGAVYSATSTTNAPAASAALQTAIVNANQSIADLIALVQTFGVQLN
jgi:hypothetical protein